MPKGLYMMNMVPRPFRDVLLPFVEIVCAGRRGLEEPLTEDFKEKVRNSAKAVSRIALIALKSAAFTGIAAAISPIDSIKVSFVLGSLVSLPTVGVIVGGWLVHFGSIITIASVALESLVPFVFGTMIAACGWYILERHDYFQFGIGEVIIDKAVGLFS